MVGHKICFYGETWLIIPKSSLLPLFIWSPVECTVEPYSLKYKQIVVIATDDTIYASNDTIYASLLKQLYQLNASLAIKLTARVQRTALKIDWHGLDHD